MIARTPRPVSANRRPPVSYQTFTTSLPICWFDSMYRCASTIVFLASPDASYITGTTLDVDGGQSA